MEYDCGISEIQMVKSNPETTIGKKRICAEVSEDAAEFQLY